MDIQSRYNANSQKAIIICGPTASGKTAYAHSLALSKVSKGEPSAIVNCDSMQIYQQIPIITASPEQEMKQQLPYHLYNFKSIEQDFSVAEYLELATAEIRKIISTDQLPIIVGGTGMYVSALLNGINNIPSIDGKIRNYVRDIYAKEGTAPLYSELLEKDPIAAQKLNSGDSQRIMRALEVMLQTGKSIFEFQQQKTTSPMPEITFETIMLAPSRKFLYEMCNHRLSQMFNNGAIEEIESILKSSKQFGSSASKALAIPQIILYLQGKISKSEALKIASAKTRQYAKRQTTWFNNQIINKQILNFDSYEEYQAACNASLG